MSDDLTNRITNKIGARIAAREDMKKLKEKLYNESPIWKALIDAIKEASSEYLEERDK